MEVTDRYKTLARSSEGLYKEKGSKFIAKALHVESEDEVKEKLEEIRKEHHGARHHCYAYKLGTEGDEYRVNDDGEPSGTAGRPIYNQLLSKEVTDALVVVTRYFGGTKLGASGLVNAYKTAAREALENANIVIRTKQDLYEVIYDYPDTNEIMKIFSDFHVRIIEQDFKSNCKTVVAIRKKNSEAFKEEIEKNKRFRINYLKSEA